MESTFTRTAPKRIAAHTRTITCTSYVRDDGLWDVEARIEDRKHYEHAMLERGTLKVDAPYHSIGVTLTVDDRLTVIAVDGDMSATPFDECQAALDPLPGLVGATLGRGWRKAVDAALSRSCACTHMREMLYTVASAAIQAIPGYPVQVAGGRWPPEDSPTKAQPAFIGGCVSWREDGPVVGRHYPRFHKPKL